MAAGLGHIHSASRAGRQPDGECGDREGHHEHHVPFEVDMLLPGCGYKGR